MIAIVRNRVITPSVRSLLMATAVEMEPELTARARIPGVT